MTITTERAGSGTETECVKRNALWQLRQSRSLASMMRPLLISGLIAFSGSVFATLTDITESGSDIPRWLEYWLTAWAIAFPVVYMAAVVLSRISAVARQRASQPVGLSLADIDAVSLRATARNELKVLRHLKRD